MKAWLETIFGPYGTHPGLTVEVRTIDAQSREVGQRWFGLARLERAADYCDEMAPTCDVYVGALPRKGQGGYARDVAAAAWLFCDVDGGNDGPRRAYKLACRASIGWPDVVVLSGGGVHAYWAISPVELGSDGDRAAFIDLERRLVKSIGGEAPRAHADRAATDPARILRVPRTWNHKPPRARRTALLRCGRPADPMTIEAVDNRLPLMPVITPLPVRGPAVPADLDDEALLARAFAAKHGLDLRMLWLGDTSAFGGDESRADAALMSRLRFWCNGDRARMERLFSQSALGAREKWVRRPDYRARTIERICSDAH